MALLTLLFIAGGCSKPPTADMEETKKAVEAARGSGSTEFLPTEDKEVNEKLNAALQEIKTQDDKMAPFRNYEQAQKLLAEARQSAQKLQTDAVAKKEQAKSEALSLQTAANEAVQKAKSLVAQAPKGKGSEADLAALNADIAGLEEALPTVQQAIDKGSFREAIAKATPIKGKAEAISEEVGQAIEKMKAAGAEKAKKKGGKAATSGKPKTGTKK